MKAKSLKETRDDFEKQLKSLNLETLKLLAEDHKKAEEYIKIGRELAGADKLANKQIKETANEMQAIAKMELKKRLGE